MPTDKIFITNRKGNKLAALVDRPLGTPRTWALFAHCFTCSKDIPAAFNIAKQCVARGIAMVRFDFSGLGASGGDFSETTFADHSEDLLDVADHMSKTFSPPSLLIGHSLGGAAILAAAATLPYVRATITIGSPAEPAHVLRQFHHKIEEIVKDGSAQVRVAGREFTITDHFVRNAQATRLGNTVSQLKCAKLFLHSPVDTIVGIENAAQLYQLARHPKSFISLHKTDHLLSKRADSEYVASLISAWVEPYIDSQVAEIPPPAQGVRIAGNRTDHFRHQLITGNGHRFTVDEPERSGGSNTGPTPMQLVAAGLAGCSAITMRMYAAMKKLPLEDVQVDVVYSKEKDHHLFTRNITLSGDLDPSQRARLLHIAGNCPVHRLLKDTCEITTRLV